MVDISSLKDSSKSWVVLTISMFTILGSGLFMAISYYVLDRVQTAFQTISCLVPENVYFSTCQEWLALSIYPLLNLKYVLIFGTYMYIFGIVFGLFYLGFKTRQHPILLPIHIVASVGFTYMAIEIGNIYRTLISNDLVVTILSPFVIYNKIMLYFPQFIFFVFFISGIIGFMGLFKNKGNYTEGTEDLQ
jgi:hypothetical protein